MNERVKVRELLALNSQQISKAISHLLKSGSRAIYVWVEDRAHKGFVLQGARGNGGIAWSITPQRLVKSKH